MTNPEWCGYTSTTDNTLEHQQDLATSRIDKEYLNGPLGAANWRAFRVSQDINVLALVKGSERYVFLYDDESRSETLRILGRYASNPELSFTWYDAAVLSQKIRRESQASPSNARFSMPQPSDQDELL